MTTIKNLAECYERTTQVITGLMKKPDGSVFQPETLTLWLHDDGSDTPINDRSFQDVLGVNGGDVNASGELTLILSPADTAIHGIPPQTHVQRVAVLRWSWEGGEKTGAIEMRFTIHRLPG